MKIQLLQKLNEYSCGKYEFLKLSYVNVSKAEMSVEIGLLYPEKFESIVIEDRVPIINLITRIVDSRLKLKVKLIKSCFFAEIFMGELLSHLECYPFLQVCIQPENIDIEDRDGTKTIIMGMPTSSYNYAVDSDALPKIKDFFYYKYHQPLDFEFKELKGVEISTENIDRFVKKSESETLHLEKEGGRVINVGTRFEFIGPTIEQDATYILDARINENAVHCGTVEDLTVITRPPKTPDSPPRKLYRFKLTDFTGTMTCLHFPTVKSENIIVNLCDGKTIIANGKTQLDTHNNDGRLVFMVKNISLCTMPRRFRENRKMRKVADEYLTVFPKTYINPVQRSLFEAEPIIPDSLKNKRFCVFDIETTGLEAKSCEIIEIGAALIENGAIKETFSSFVSIDNPVPERITELTGINDSHLVDQPCVKDVLADFLKFSQGAALVGHNVAFDYSFISYHGEKNNIYFDNERIDTIILAKRRLPNLKNYTLKTVAAKLGVQNNAAHRALSDAIATAEAFIKLSNLPDA